jgi:hypothetical protein
MHNPPLPGEILKEDALAELANPAWPHRILQWRGIPEFRSLNITATSYWL